MSKIYAFDYMLSLFEEWYNKENKERNRGFEKCSKLSVLKLLFLASAPKGGNSIDLLDIFNNYYALPYGPVESDIYNAIQNDDLPSYTVKDRTIIAKNTQMPLPYSIGGFSNIKRAVDELKNMNNSLIGLNAFELVEITHKWESWNKSIEFARFIGASSYKMTSEAIRNDSSRCFR